MTTIWQPSAQQIERMRLLLSTYQDGTGMLTLKDGSTLPGWRDFERSVSLAFNGQAMESKAIFDVILADPESSDTRVGISCKMRRELDRVNRDGRVTIEVSNSAGEFWDYLNTLNLDQTTYKRFPEQVGAGLLHVVQGWHLALSLQRNGLINLDRSSYLVLQWNLKGAYQLFQYDLTLPDPTTIHWSFPFTRGSDVIGRRLTGEVDSGLLFEWYGESGGQLKYYPFAEQATWKSEPFQLEPMPTSLQYGILAKAAAYFPDRWTAANA